MLSKYKQDLNRVILILAKPFMRVHPDILSVIGTLFPILFLYFMIQQKYLAALVSFLSVFYDTVDGAVARATGKVTKFGGLLDSTLDRISDSIYIISFYYAGIISIELTLMLLLSSYLISYIRSRAELAGKGSFVLNVGLIERPERMIFLVSALIAELFAPGLAKYILIMMLILSVVTVLQRMFKARSILASIAD